MRGGLKAGRQFGDMALHCAELLNKWAAASPAYSNDLVTRAAGTQTHARARMQALRTQAAIRAGDRGEGSARCWPHAAR